MAAQYSHQELRWIQALIQKHIGETEQAMIRPDCPDGYKAIMRLDLDNHKDLLSKTNNNLNQPSRKRKPPCR